MSIPDRLQAGHERHRFVDATKLEEHADHCRDRRFVRRKNRTGRQCFPSVLQLTLRIDVSAHRRQGIRGCQPRLRGQPCPIALEPCQSFGVGGKRIRQDFDCDLPAQRRVRCSIDLSYAPLSKWAGDFIGTEASDWWQWQEPG